VPSLLVREMVRRYMPSTLGTNQPYLTADGSKSAVAARFVLLGNRTADS
jgi:hypothetical protein